MGGGRGLLCDTVRNLTIQSEFNNPYSQVFIATTYDGF